jgi:hypothetical protein
MHIRRPELMNMLKTPRAASPVSVLPVSLVLLVLLAGNTRAGPQMAASLPTPALITFDEVRPFTENPVISAGGTTYSFGSIFVGQRVGDLAHNPGEVIDPVPSQPLRLARFPRVATLPDMATNPGNMVLGGYDADRRTAFTTPISFQMDVPARLVSFDLGHLDGAFTTTIDAFRADGTKLNATVLRDFDPETGFAHVRVRDKGGSGISGISIYVDGPSNMDWEGFAIDNLGSEPIPEPTPLVIWTLLAAVALSLAGSRGWLSRRRDQAGA